MSYHTLRANSNSATYLYIHDKIYNTPGNRGSGSQMDAVINFNKPKDLSSQQAVTKVKRVLAARKAGHAGTLDPVATGVLLVCLNEATKITRFLSDLGKEYVVRLKLGERTDTYDLTGRVIEERDVLSIREDKVLKILTQFTGAIQQTPPMYSAIKIDGKPLYKLARLGIEVKRPERTVHIYGIEFSGFHLPYLDLKISCSKGTYIRTLCDDIGQALRVGAHMVSLERTRVGNFIIENALTIEELRGGKNAFYSIDYAIAHLKEIVLDESSFHQARKGMPVIMVTDNLLINQYVRLKSPKQRLFGIGKVEHNRIKIERLLN